MTSRTRRAAVPRMLGVLLAAAACLAPMCGNADVVPPPADVAFDQHLGAALPLHERFVDDRGNAGTLADFAGGLPAIIVLGYYECPNLCGTVRQSLLRSLAAVDLDPGTRYRVLAVSIDAAETGSDAAHARAALDADVDGRGATPDSGAAPPPSSLRGWRFLTGTPSATRALAGSVGFHYVYDAALGQFAHPAGIVVATPQGRVSQYLLGVEYPPAVLRASLVAAAGESVGAPVRALLLRCFHYDPVTGRYTMDVIWASRLLGFACVALLLAGLLRLRRHARAQDAMGAR